MRENENLVRSCDACEYYEVGCEENCPFELEREAERPTLRGRRRDMKAEKAKACAKALQKLNSAENKAAQETNYEKSKNKHIRNLEKEIEQLEGVHESKMGDPFNAYPRAVFDARANAIKQAERSLKRLEKKQAKK